MRSFLRHLHQRGDIAVDLADAIPPITNWRLSELPKSLPPEKVESVLASCDLDTAGGRRDHAILLLLARLGVRGGEVATLTLEDIDWDKGVVTLSGKGQRREALPLPEEVGRALAAYLRDGRPPCGTRRVFVRAIAPYRGFSSTMAICDIVRRALARAGIEAPLKGAHLLRRSLACGMLENGASLEEIGQILRHRHPETTQIYAKVRPRSAAHAGAGVAGRCVVIDLRTLLDEYLATRRALGVRLHAAGRLLERFVAFAGQQEALFVTTELALRWATQPNHAQPAQWAKRLGLVRGFARYANAVDPRHRIPAHGLIAHRYRRRRPYLHLQRPGDRRPDRGGAGPVRHHGGETLHLCHAAGAAGGHGHAHRRDPEARPGRRRPRPRRSDRSRQQVRQVAPHPAARVRELALGRYAAQRDRLCPAPRDPAFFLNESGTRITEWTLRHTFVRLSRQTGLREPAKSNGDGPRLLDMRHSFAVGTMVRWYRDGVDVERHIPRLATWLGHDASKSSSGPGVPPALRA